MTGRSPVAAHAPSPATDPIRVVVADDHERFRDGLVRRLRSDPRFDVVGVGTCGETAVGAIVEHRPDVAVIDLRLPALDALEVWQRVRAADPAMGRSIMVLTATPDDLRAEQTRAAIDGTVRSKDRSRREILDDVVVHAASVAER